ncbi:MAG TPA: SLBB domain-containing protein [Gemmatimonadales bacterium]|nr:SLBB domain-containing protein [Gemmatimonadales bacterium]
MPRKWLGAKQHGLTLVLLALASMPGPVVAQQPTPAQAEQLLQQRPELVLELRRRMAASGLTPAQIRSRLEAEGYPPTLLDAYMVGADTVGVPAPSNTILDVVGLLGIAEPADIDSLRVLTDSAQLVADSLRADSLAHAPEELQIFGLDVFRRSGTEFDPILAGPVDENYRLGAGDVLVLILTGDVELAHSLEVTREGFVVIPQVGQVYVANLTMGELEDQLYARLGRVYSGVRRGRGATTQFQVTVAKIRTIQVFVVGEVARPGSYQMAGTGTVLTALYAAGGPTENGSFRNIEVRRGGNLASTLDGYAYLLRGITTHDIRLESGDVVFVPPRAMPVTVTGKVVRPAIYEFRQGETLRDAIAAAGGFTFDASVRSVQIHRTLPPAARGPAGAERTVIDVPSDQVARDTSQSFALAPGDSVVVFSVPDRRRGYVTVTGGVWTEGPVGFTAGMRLSDAIRLAGGPKPDVYLGQILVTRLTSDSSRVQLRSAFRDSTGAVIDDLVLQDEDEITVFGRTAFRPERFVTIGGAVREPGEVPYRDGMTLRDAVLLAQGLTEDAYLGEAEIGHIPTDRSGGALATTVRVPLDSTYLVERGPDGAYLGPPGIPAPAGGAPEVVLRPYDNISILHQPEWDLPRTVAIYGQVRFPGRYALRNREERLVDLIERAGGLTGGAYPAGVAFHRSLNKQGRIGIDLPKALRNRKFRDNLILATGDSVFIPEYSPVIEVAGAVNAPVAVAYNPGKNTDYYVSAAGGFRRDADKNRTYVVQPSGQHESVKGRFFFADDKPKPLAGARVVVPAKDPNATGTDLGRVFTPIAQVLASLVTLVVLVTR